MTCNQQPYDVIIAGAGPVGLLLGLRLQQLGLNFILLEKRREPFQHSRSIGIHPPSLRLFDRLQVSKPLLREGICIQTGLALYDKTRELGMLDFGRCPKPYSFILSLPQFHTERILKEALLERRPGCLRESLEVVDFREHPTHVTVTVRDAAGIVATVRSRFLVGCDGKNSRVRTRAGLAFRGWTYPGHYAMGDFRDETAFGCKAVIYVDNEGLVESFPLPGSRRRWVAELNGTSGPASPVDFCRVIENRTGLQVDASTQSMYSGFKAGHYLAETFYAGRVLLAGDAAHLISPIGGQGMNLGWLNAWDMGEWLGQTVYRTCPDMKRLRKWDIKARLRSRKAMRRAGFNMALGHKTRWPGLRRRLIALLLKPPFNKRLARRFTMEGLE
ncbi:MAG: NAD(P)/FAD-dependent oxidoreductase [Balneolales bacterium]